MQQWLNYYQSSKTKTTVPSTPKMGRSQKRNFFEVHQSMFTSQFDIAHDKIYIPVIPAWESTELL